MNCSHSMTAADWIAEQRRIEQAATEGPWEVCEEDWACISHGPDSVIHGYYEGECSACGSSMLDKASVALDGEDAEFIAAARAALPNALDALEAVLALHQPVKIYAQADECGCGDEDPTIIESPQGDDLCWDTPTGELCCPECLDEDSGAIDYPCPTVAAITEALT